MSQKIKVMGLDPGFASIGVAVMEISKDAEKVVEVLVVHTVKSDKKHKVRASDDNVRRARAIYAVLSDVILRHPEIKIISAETMSFPRNSSTAAKMAMCWGVISSLVEGLQLPLVQASPQDIKLALTGSKTSAKVEVQEALRTRYEGGFEDFMNSYKKSDWEHGFDAAGTVVACMDSDVIRLLRGMAA